MLKFIIKFFLLISFSFLIVSCAQTKIEKVKENVNQNSVVKKDVSVLEKKSCKEESRIITSTKRFIKFRHDVNEVDKYKEIAANWCMKFSKIPKKSKVRCSRCCDASYFCK